MACSSKINVIMALVMIVTLVSIGQATAARRLQQAGGLPGFPSYPLPTTPGFPTPSVGGFPGLPSFPLPAPSDPNVPAKTTTP
ncbi:non-ous end joining protein Ku-like [Capsicum galapagoense]